ncbi:MAG: PAS domain-containing protein [Planctomycetes bacterium]|jgi:PAS domain S-box-containing protein|nr:PAS domain-containing protein [Planctomycetota bacterium]MCL4731586.1 PAS domain-containing protein [Planctomycetota bacterium]
MNDPGHMDFLARFVDHLPVITLFVANDEHYTLKFASLEGARLLGYSPEDFKDNRRFTAASVIHPDDQAISDEQTERIMATGRAVAARYRVVAADGTPIPVLDISRLYDEPGREPGLITVLVDLRLAPPLQGQSCVFGPA